MIAVFKKASRPLGLLHYINAYFYICDHSDNFALLACSSPDFEEVKNLLQYSLSSLCCHLSDWPSLLCDYQEPRNTKYCLVLFLYLALKHGDR